MKNLELYTPEICSQLRRVAEARQWRSWRDLGRAEVELDLELSYHLHIAAEASGKRSGMPPMPPCPIRLPFEQPPDPAQFLHSHYEDLLSVA